MSYPSLVGIKNAYSWLHMGKTNMVSILLLTFNTQSLLK